MALWTGKIEVRGLRNLGTFEKLFPIKSLDFAPAPVEELDVKITTRAEMLIEANAAYC